MRRILAILLFVAWWGGAVMGYAQVDPTFRNVNITGGIKMNSHSITGLPNAAATGQPCTYGNVSVGCNGSGGGGVVSLTQSGSGITLTPNPFATTGTIALNITGGGAVSNKFVSAISTDGVVTLAQPSFANISGVAVTAQGGTNCASPLLFAALPGSPTIGTTCTVTDANACATGTAVTVGGGATKCQLTWNNVNWMPAGNATSGSVTSVATTSPISGGPVTSTGTISCPTCATTTNGGALSGTSPIAISVAGVISIGAPYGATTYTAHGVLLGEGGSNIAATAVCGTGTVLYGQSAADPICSTLTLPNVATTGDLLEATGTNAIGRLADVAVGQVLTSGGVGTVPAWSASPTITGITLSGLTGTQCVHETAGVLSGTGSDCGAGGGGSGTVNSGTGPQFAQYGAGTTTIVSGQTASGAVTLASGGVFSLNAPYGATTYTVHGLLVGEAGSNIAALAAGTNGQVPIGSTGADPVMATVGSGTGISTTTGAGTLTINNTGVTSAIGTANQVNVSGATGAVTFSLVGPYTPSTYTAHGILVGEGTGSIVPLAVCGTGSVPYGQAGADPVCSTLTFPNAATTGDILEATGTNAIGRLADVATGQVLTSGGVGVAPAWSNSPSVTTSTATGSFNPNLTQTTINGTVGGSAICSEPFQGTAYKHALCYLNAFNSTALNYTFAVAFTNAPVFLANTTNPATATASVINLPTGAATTGWLIVEGY
jgi:trimeric autotransporter adhesin